MENHIILKGLKKKQETIKRKWVEELPSVLWSYKTTLQNEVEVMILVELGIGK